MVEVKGGEENARERVKQLFDDKQVNRVQLDIRPEEGTRWQQPSSAGWYGIPDGSSTKFAVTRATVDVVDWLQLQANILGHSLSSSAIERWVACYEADDLPCGYSFLDEAKVETAEATADNPTQMPEPVLELKRKTDAPETKIQEGRSRALGAKLAGLDRIPIWVAARRDRK